MKKHILGINCSGFRSSACLLEDGKVRHAICEERLSRLKQDNSFPLRSIKYCCDGAGIELSDISDVFIGWHPRHYLNKSDRTLLDAFRSRGKMSYLALNELGTLAEEQIEDVAQKLMAGKINWDIRFVDHHKAHLANVYFQSGFKGTDFLILDGFGEKTTGICGSISGRDLEIYNSFVFPHSMGSFYSVFTEYLGFKADRDEWKVMALASLGDPDSYYDVIRPMVKVDGLKLELDLSYFEHYLFFTEPFFTNKLVDLLGEPLQPGAEPTQRHCDIVASAQRVVEEVVFELLNNLQKTTGGNRLVVGGGCFMNSVLNGKICDNTPYKELFIGGSPDDTGISVGSALYGANFVLNQPTNNKQVHHNYFGRPYTEEEVEKELMKRKLKFRKVKDPAKEGAKIIRDGKILGWFQGACELGQRALGNRSILADPTREDVKDLVNSSVKYREGFRPFAPSVLIEKQKDIFTGGEETSYFMEKVFPFKEEWIKKVPGVVHFDNTGRLQSVSKEVNPLYYSLISEFEKLSKVPLVLNTSFNIAGMPLVETPGDAISCFYESGIDALIMDNYLVEKQPS